MKKLLSVLVLVALGVTAKAQLWAGGSLGFSHSGGVEKTLFNDSDKPSENSFSIAPIVGYNLNENLSVGGKLVLNVVTYKEEYDSYKTELTDFGFGITPFARYTVLKSNKFELQAEAGLPILATKMKITEYGQTEKGTVSVVGFYAKPILAYSISDHFQLECELDFLSLNANHIVAKTDDDEDYKDITNSFDFGFDSGNVATLGEITIGVIYKF